MKLNYQIGFPILWFLLILATAVSSCKHDPFFEDVTPIDTTTIIDTTTVDTTVIDTSGVDTTGIPCDSDVVYFRKDVMPILFSNCAMSGCHDAATAEKGVILTDFENLIRTTEVTPFDLNGSEIYKVIVDNNPDDQMPPEPRNSLNAQQIQLIAKWILQGAQDLECDENAVGCDTDNIRFLTYIKPFLDNHCKGCHSGSVPSGGISLTNHPEIAAVANQGKLFGAIAREPGFTPMPFGGERLQQCDIDKFESWIDAGAMNN